MARGGRGGRRGLTSPPPPLRAPTPTPHPHTPAPSTPLHPKQDAAEGAKERARDVADNVQDKAKVRGWCGCVGCVGGQG